MKKNTAGKYKRNIFTTANKYQSLIILLSFVPTCLTFLIFIIFIFAGNPILTKAVFHNSFQDLSHIIYIFSTWIIVGLCLVFILSIVYSFVLSNYLVGIFSRIINEMDDIISGKSQKQLTCRPKDFLAVELLKRVNVLIEFYVKNKK